MLKSVFTKVLKYVKIFYVKENFKVEFVVTKECKGKRLDIFLMGNVENTSRSHIKNMIDSGKVLVNKKEVKAGYTLKENDSISVENVEPEELKIEAKKMELDIIYEDDDIIVINKEKGVVVHPGNGNYTDTIVNGLLYSHKDKLSSINNVIRPGIVHRIDKDTSGIIVIAKNDNAHKKLSEQFKVHSITREYVMLAKGIIKEDEFTVNQPIGRSIRDRKKMAVTDKNSKEAITHFKVLERFYTSKITYLLATLETGRTHQIRVHMKYKGYPLLGDEVYGTKSQEFKVTGQMLHAQKLGFIHPTTNKYIEFFKEPPKEFQDILTKLRNKEK